MQDQAKLTPFIDLLLLLVKKHIVHWTMQVSKDTTVPPPHICDFKPNSHPHGQPEKRKSV